MKKLVVLIVIILIVGCIAFQNGATWVLKLMALSSGVAPQTPPSSAASGQTPPYKDGSFIGSVADAFYGNIQVQAVISGGKITDVQFLQHPSDRTRSIAINTLAMPTLTQEAITNQSATVDIVSGATDTSQAFIQSLSNALAQAK